MLMNSDLTVVDLPNLVNKKKGEKYQEDKVFKGLTLEEREELEILHEVEMLPSQEEEDWMLTINIKDERKHLASKYLPQMSNYKIEDICEICKRYFYKKGNIETHMKEVHVIEQLPQMLQVIPHEGWLSKSLPNLKDMLATIPLDILVSEEDQNVSKRDFEDIMCEVRKVNAKMPTTKHPSIFCSKCKFSTTSNESMKIHTDNVHEQCVYKCDICTTCFISDHSLKTHKDLTHLYKKDPIVKKNPLNLTKGEAGGMSDCQSNPNRGHAYKNCKPIVSSKRDIKSKKSGSNYQINKKESTKVDIKPGFNYQTNKNEKITNNFITTKKKDEKSKKPGFKYQDIKKDSNQLDKNLGGGDEVGDVEGKGKVGDDVDEINVKHELEDDFGCKICGELSKNTKEHHWHLLKSHSESAINLAKEVINKNSEKHSLLKSCEKCGRNFLYKNTLVLHMQNCNIGNICMNIFKNGNIDSDSVKITTLLLDEIIEKSVQNLKNPTEKPVNIECDLSVKIIGGGEDIEIHGLDSDDDWEETDVESVNSEQVPSERKKKYNSLYTKKQWGDDEDNPDPAGINFKSKLSAFKKCADKLKKVFRKGSIRKIGDTIAMVEEVKRKGSGTEYKIKVTDPGGEGEVMLSIWEPNKKTKESTVQVNSRKGNDKRLVKHFADVFVKEIIEKVSENKNVEELFQKIEAKVSCTVCNKSFAKETKLNVHMKTHIMCNKCGKGFMKEHEFESHKALTHNSQHKSKTVQTHTEETKLTCEDCDFTAASRKSLMIHKEDKHIEDSWLVNTKRDATMMNSVMESKIT